MLKKIRVILAAIFFICITLLFLDFTGTVHAWLGWMAKIQLLPALLALNVGVIVALVVLTLLLGRVYCSVICPLGVMQDIFGWMGKKRKKNRYSYSPAKNILRYTMLAVMVAAIVLGIGSVVALLAPYSTYGRIAQNLLAPGPAATTFLPGWRRGMRATLFILWTYGFAAASHSVSPPPRWQSSECWHGATDAPTVTRYAP